MTFLYRFALLAYPRAFRRDFGEAMLDMIGEQHRRVAGPHRDRGHVAARTPRRGSRPRTRPAH